MSTALQMTPQLVPGGNINSYIHAVNNIAILTKEEEQQLAEDYAYNGNVESARQMVLSHLRFVVYIARSYSGYGLPLSDLIQEGNVGLMKAVHRFDPEQGVRLVSYAVHWIKAEMHEFILKNWRIVKVATTKAQRKLFFNLRSAKKRLGWLTNDEAEAIASDLGVEAKEVHSMEGRLSAHDMAFDPLTNEDDESAWQAPSNYLEDHNADPSMLIEHEDSASDNESRLADAMSDLDTRSQDILTRRWLSDKKATLHELADEYGISAERIRQLEANAMKKIKAALVA